MKKQDSLTPKRIVAELDRYIVGQNKAKKSIAIALRNRFRRSKLPDEMRNEIIPKNILMIGPTGVGKTEIARRIAKLVGAPFIKVEATKFTEVGYVGRDVESMVRDLIETAIRMVKEEKLEAVMERAEILANERIVELLVPQKRAAKGNKNPLELLFGLNQEQSSNTQEDDYNYNVENERRRIAFKLAAGELEDHVIEIEIEENHSAMLENAFSNAGFEQMTMSMQEILSNFMPKKKKRRRLTVKEARKILKQEEAMRLIDMDEVTQESVRRAEEAGIIFIDEFDKIASKGNTQSVDVSREGVQRDILPIVEGSTVMTKYGPVKTDYVLFIAAGAFHMSKPSDLIPELQGRFPIRVELENLTSDDFVRILTEPQHALTKQYISLLETEGIKIEFTPDAIKEIAQIAADVNTETDNIGARRLHTILEKLLEDLSYEAPDITLEKILITPQYVNEKLREIVKNRDLSQYIL